MSKSETKGLDIQWISLRLMERFKNVLYPIEVPVLLRLLPNIGYVVPSKRLKGVIEPGEALAIKGDLELLLNQDNKTLGVAGRDILETVEGFKELRNFWMEQISPDPVAETHYVEMGGEGFVKSNINPSEAFNNFWAEFDRMQKISKIIGFDVTNFGFRLVPQSMQPNNPEWFDLRIQPQVLSSANHYYINIVWRTGDLAYAMDNFMRISDIIDQIIKGIEMK